MSRYDYILLDWDGNLAKTLDLWQHALKVPLEKRGHHLPDSEIGANFDALKAKLKARGFEDVDGIITEADEIASQLLPLVELYPDVLEVLESLHMMARKTALVTTSKHDYVDPLLKKYHIDKLFEVVVCGDDVTEHKPSSEPLLQAISALNGDVAKAVMIGDSDKDIIAANNAGVDSILFYPPGHDRFHDIAYLKGLKPTHVISDFREVLALV
jgi:HAD superfamily hydrolase (TIGR01509 family)